MFDTNENFTTMIVPGSPARTFLVQVSKRDTYFRYDVFDVFEEIDGGYKLLTIADPMRGHPTPDQLASLITTRKVHLMNLLAEHHIVASNDYPEPPAYRALWSDTQCGRWVALTRDETYWFAFVSATVSATLPEALDTLAGQAGQDTGGLVVGVFDLDTEVLHETRTTVTLAIHGDDVTELSQALTRVAEAVEGASNDEEIDAYREALDLALGRWPEVEAK